MVVRAIAGVAAVQVRNHEMDIHIHIYIYFILYMLYRIISCLTGT